AQVTARQKEFALRAALGASRARLARQFITENVVLALVAGALGVLLSIWGVDLLIGLNQGALPRANEIGVNIRALIFTLGLSLVIAVILGLIPVMRLSDRDLQSDLKDSGRGLSAHAASKRLRSLLVILQVAFTLILLVCAGLLGKSFLRLLQVDPGFKVENTLVMDLSIPVSRDEQQMKQLMSFFKQLQEGRAPAQEAVVDGARLRQQALFYQQLLERVGQLRGVSVVGGIDSLPMTGRGGNGTFWIDNNITLTGSAEYRLATEGYFAAMGIPLVRGRMFDQNDRPDSPPVAVINQALVQKVWPNEDPIGKRIQFGNMDGDIRLIEIIGVVGDVRERGLDSDVRPIVYAYGLQRPPSSSLSLVARAQTDAAALIPAMRQVVQELNPELPTNFRTLEQIFSSSLDKRRFSLVIFAVFAAVALMLAAAGIYGVVSYSVTQRTHEIGVRMALGAQARDVMRMIMGNGLKLALAGVGLGVGAAFALTRLMASLLYGVTASDPVTFIATSLLLTAIALLACYIPGRRATRVDPITALRHD
ncbi:MAG TPA: FtsX-like permease family protein, partial [Blastocatellia bacterium]